MKIFKLKPFRQQTHHSCTKLSMKLCIFIPKAQYQRDFQAIFIENQKAKNQRDFQKDFHENLSWGKSLSQCSGSRLITHAQNSQWNCAFSYRKLNTNGIFKQFSLKIKRLKTNEIFKKIFMKILVGASWIVQGWRGVEVLPMRRHPGRWGAMGNRRHPEWHATS